MVDLVGKVRVHPESDRCQLFVCLWWIRVQVRCLYLTPERTDRWDHTPVHWSLSNTDRIVYTFWPMDMKGGKCCPKVNCT